MITFPLLVIGFLALFVMWVIENFGAYLRWLIGALIFVTVVPVAGLLLLGIHEFLLNL